MGARVRRNRGSGEDDTAPKQRGTGERTVQPLRRPKGDEELRPVGVCPTGEEEEEEGVHAGAFE